MKLLFKIILLAGMCFLSSCTNRVCFIQISDPQIGFLEDGVEESKALFERTVQMINKLSPDFVVVTGDMVNKPGDSLQLAVYFNGISKIEDEIPVYHIPGNHDIKESSELSRQAYIDRFGYDRFSFTKQGHSFIGINTCPIKAGDMKTEQEQFEWLEKELEKAGDPRNRIIFTHCPIVVKDIDEEDEYMNFPKEIRKKYMDLFRKYNVSLVLSGHLHNNASCTADGIELITSGPCGKPLGTGVSGITIVNIEKGVIKHEYLPLK